MLEGGRRVLGRSHATLTFAAYVALALHPLPSPVGDLAAPALQFPGGDVGVAPLAASGVLAAVGALLPDLDSPESLAARTGGVPLRAASWLFRLTVGHRGPFHSLLAVAAVAVLGNAAGETLGFGGVGGVLAFGWLMHLLQDALTRHGVPFLWPIPLDWHLPPGLRTGGVVEHLVVLTVLAVCGWWVLGAQTLVAAVAP